MRKTKIVCTIGPASNDRDTLVAMCRAGMNVARLNFSHGTHEDHLRTIELIRSVREELHEPIAILLDTKGPEYRIKTFENGFVNLSEGDEFAFTSKDIIGNEHEVSVSYGGMMWLFYPKDTAMSRRNTAAFIIKSGREKS